MKVVCMEVYSLHQILLYLPSDIISILETGADSYTNWDVNIVPLNIYPELDLDLFISSLTSDEGIFPGIEYAMIWGANSESVNLIP